MKGHESDKEKDRDPRCCYKMLDADAYRSLARHVHVQSITVSQKLTGLLGTFLREKPSTPGGVLQPAWKTR